MTLMTAEQVKEEMTVARLRELEARAASGGPDDLEIYRRNMLDVGIRIPTLSYRPLVGDIYNGYMLMERKGENLTVCKAYVTDDGPYFNPETITGLTLRTWNSYKHWEHSAHHSQPVEGVVGILARTGYKTHVIDERKAFSVGPAVDRVLSYAIVTSVCGRTVHVRNPEEVKFKPISEVEPSCDTCFFLKGRGCWPCFHPQNRIIRSVIQWTT